MNQVSQTENTNKERIESDLFRILIALRRISHCADQYSKKLSTQHNITGPQLLCLHILARNPEMTLSKLSRLASLSASTTNGIVDRLESKGLVVRQRQTLDRRKVIVRPTEKGRKFAQDSPLILQDKLSEAVSALPEMKRSTITMSLEEIVRLMGAEE